MDEIILYVFMFYKKEFVAYAPDEIEHNRIRQQFHSFCLSIIFSVLKNAWCSQVHLEGILSYMQ